MAPTSNTRKVQQHQPQQSNGRNQQGGAPSAPTRKVVGQYMLGKAIGEGTFGKVKLAIHLPTGEKVAVKILEKARIKEQADVRRVNREIKILKKSRHRNVIQLYEVLDTQNSIYLIMENCEGGEMFDYIVQHKHVPEIQACKFFHQIIDGVENLHINEITHRDLKPENLLLKSSKNGWLVKIVDFGLSNTHEGGRLLSTACGSPCYAAPEMIAGKKYVGPLADIWSLGVILFALVCGYLPFEDQNTSVLYKKILSGEYKTAKWISAEVSDLIRNILETDPAKRYNVSDIRKHAWYKQVSDADIPTDVLSDEENSTIRDAVLNQLQASDVNVQQVLDGLNSKACNGNTAMYHLLAQKITQTIKDNEKKQLHTKIHPTGSESSNPYVVGNKGVQNVSTVDNVGVSIRKSEHKASSSNKNDNPAKAIPSLASALNTAQESGAARIFLVKYPFTYPYRCRMFRTCVVHTARLRLANNLHRSSMG